MRNSIGKFLLLVAIGIITFACKDVSVKPEPKPEPAVFKIAVNVIDGEDYDSQIDSVEAYYTTKDDKTVVLARLPYNNGKFELELLDTIQNRDFKTIIESYTLKSIINDVSVSDTTTLMSPIAIRCIKDGEITEYYISPQFTIDGADNASGKYYYCNKKCELSIDKNLGDIHYVMNLKLVKGYNFIQGIISNENGSLKSVFTTQPQGDFVWKVWKEDNGGGSCEV